MQKLGHCFGNRPYIIYGIMPKHEFMVYIVNHYLDFNNIRYGKYGWYWLMLGTSA